MKYIQILKKLGFDEKEIKIYITLLSLGPSSVRMVAEEAGINRGTTYDILKKLIEHGLAAYYNKEKKQYFVAEDPDKLSWNLESKINEMKDLKLGIEDIIPELKSMYDRGGGKAVSKYYEGNLGMKYILEDVLNVMDKSEEKNYYVYSSSDLRNQLYKEFPNFTKQRIKNNILVKVLAIGRGGEDQELSERKWIKKESGSPAYVIIYGSKTAHISLDNSGSPFGVVVEDKNIADTHKIIFEKIWTTI